MGEIEVIPGDCFALKTRSSWATDAVWRQEETDNFPVSVFCFWVFRLPALPHCSDWFHFLLLPPFLPPFGLSLFISPVSAQPFRHFVCVTNCLHSLSFSASFPSTCSLPASFHLFLYLSQWELMWPLCAVSSPLGRQSSSAPIRTALSGAVCTGGLPTHSPLLVCHPAPRDRKAKRSERKGTWHGLLLNISFTHSFSLSPPASLIKCVCFHIPVFWSLRSQHS